MRIPSSEMLSPERRRAERDAERKQKLFFRFDSKEQRDKALAEIESIKEFQDEFRQLDNIDSDPRHPDTGFMLHFNGYQPGLLNKLQDIFQRVAKVVDKHEWIIEPEEQAQEAEVAMKQKSAPLPKKANVVEMQPRKPLPDAGEVWKDDRAA